MAKTTKTQIVQIKGIGLARGKITIKGVTPYISSRMSDTAKQDMINAATGKKGEKKRIYDMDKEYKECFYKDTKGRYCIPASAIKKSITEASVYLFSKQDGGAKRVKGSLHMTEELIPIQYKKVVPVDDFVRDPNRIVRRPYFYDWTATFEVEYNTAQLSPEQLHTLVNLAGFQIGIGAWRPQCGGTKGRFKIA